MPNKCTVAWERNDDHDLNSLKKHKIFGLQNKEKKTHTRNTRLTITLTIFSSVSASKNKTNPANKINKNNIPVFSFISHKTLKRAGFILWQFSACFLKRGQDTPFQINILTSGNSNKSHLKEWGILKSQTIIMSMIFFPPDSPAVLTVRSRLIYKTSRKAKQRKIWIFRLNP